MIELDKPGKRQFIERTSIQLRPHPEFKKADLETRQVLYLELAKRVWDPSLLSAELVHCESGGR